MMFLSAESGTAGEIVIVGFPWDSTTSFRPGARFGPQAIREASYGIESYSPYQDSELESLYLSDAGDVELPFGDTEEALRIVEETISNILTDGKKIISLGGEHLISLPVIKAYSEKYAELWVLHFDAHLDMRDEYLGVKLSHATVMKRVSEIVGPRRVIHLGIRSGTREEFLSVRELGTLTSWKFLVENGREALKNKNVYVSFDVDVFDPSVVSGTGTPEPGGIFWGDFISVVQSLKGVNVVGADVVELAPHYDHSGVSSVVCAEVVRELALLIGLRD